MKNKQLIICVIACIAAGISCNGKHDGKLPILGERSFVKHVVDGKEQIDTAYHTIPDFSFVDQDSNQITNETFKGKIYLADFFFTRCPTICPIVSRNMLTIAKHFEGDNRVAFLSHTIDPRYDTPEVLKHYAEKIDAPDSWYFVNGAKDSVYPLAGTLGYFSFAEEDSDAPGGFNHSGALTLVDQQRRVRGLYDGTLTDSIPKIITDIELLLNKG